jgi:hypothetical protein
VAPPVPIPNTEVKHCCADDSWAIGPAKVGRCQSITPPIPHGVGGVFFYPYRIQHRLGCSKTTTTHQRTIDFEAVVVEDENEGEDEEVEEEEEEEEEDVGAFARTRGLGGRCAGVFKLWRVFLQGGVHANWACALEGSRENEDEDDCECRRVRQNAGLGWTERWGF